MQENNESEKPEDPDAPEKEITSSDAEGTPPLENSDSLESDSQFEEHDGEILNPDKKKKSGCGFFLFILFLLGGGGGYLYYTDQVPLIVTEWMEPLLQTQNPQRIQGTPRVSEKPGPNIESKPISPPFSEEVAAIPPARISGNSNLIEREIEPLEEEPEEEANQEQVRETSPRRVTPPPAPQATPATEEAEQQEETIQKRNEAVQAYLDFFETTLVKIRELIKTGFSKGKDYLKKSFS